ncbi:hydrolase [Roseomonas sp. OT10]|uniref:glycosyl hydrolase family 28-related protein n=1 Tax=Roseomonas cutis TaxID=2897332 RepID=UPI001E6399AF|nr:glycosyl hydrolase family 28-related protein [Roseomonas sp. OT10]UFN47964.1 hydrolase [Roseomonas sp. OT10]
MAEHIRIGDVAPRVHYVASGGQTVFVYPFPIFDIADLEVRVDGLLLGSGFAVAGAGESEGGTVAFAVPPAPGAQVLLRRRLRIDRTTDFQPNGVLRANTLNDELDRQTAALQEVSEDLTGTIRLDPGEAGGRLVLPLKPARANRLLGFDSTGDLAVFSRGETTLSVPFPGGIPRTVEDKLAEILSARDFGATGDSVTDDGPALQAAMNAAAAAGKVLEIGEGTFRTTMPLVLPGAAAGLSMRGAILYAGPDGNAALTLGEGGSTRNLAKAYQGIRVLRATLASWTDERDIGVLARNMDAGLLDVRQVEGFTIGLRTLGDAIGFEDSTVQLGRLVNNRIGLDVRTGSAAGWNNSIRYQGGHFANASGTHPTMDRFGVRFSCEPGAYPRHNAHLFMGPAFELQRQGTPGTVAAIPFLLEAGDERGIVARGVRMEACSPHVARHAGGASDCLYEVSYTGTYAFTGTTVEYTSTATRAGGTVVPLHQATAAQGAPRLIAAAENVRARAFRQTVDAADGIGFEEMGVLSGNPNGSPTTLNALVFAGLSSIGLNPDHVGLPTSRALAFVVDASECKEFFLAAEGTSLRPVVVQFDASEAVLTDTTPVLFSNMNAVWAGSPSYFWEGNVNLDSLVGGIAMNRLQRVTLHDSARFAAIGVRGGTSDAVLRALRLYCAPLYAPTLIYGGSRRWGTREYTVVDTGWNPGTLAAGAIAQREVTLPGVRQGDFVQASYVGVNAAGDQNYQNGGAVLHAVVGGSASANQVKVTAQNISGGAIAMSLGNGTLRVRAVKPRL